MARMLSGMRGYKGVSECLYGGVCSPDVGCVSGIGKISVLSAFGVATGMRGMCGTKMFGWSRPIIGCPLHPCHCQFGWGFVQRHSL